MLVRLEGQQICGLTIKWDYQGRKVHLLMPGFIRKTLTRFQHPPPAKRQDEPYPHVKPNYGAKKQYAQEDDNSPALNKALNKFVQEFCGVFLFLTWAVNGGLLPPSARLLLNRQTQRKKQLGCVSNFWILWLHRKKQYSPITQATWSLQSSAMRCTSPN